MALYFLMLSCVYHAFDNQVDSHIVVIPDLDTVEYGSQLQDSGLKHALLSVGNSKVHPSRLDVFSIADSNF